MQANHQGMRLGADISHWQGPINFKKLVRDGVTFVIIKATEGTTFVDPRFSEYYKEAKAAGLDVSFYHFARFTSRGVAEREADHFIEHVGKLDNDLPLCLDIETTQGLGAAVLTDCAIAFLERVADKTGDQLAVYTYTYFARNRLTPELEKYLCWIADWGDDKPAANPIWDKYFIHQYTNHGDVDGIDGPVDLNYMDEAVLDGSKHPVQNRDPKIAVATGDVWIHDAPNFDEDSRVEVLKKGEHVKTYGITGECFNLGNGRFVSGNYLKIVEAMPEPSTAAQKYNLKAIVPFPGTLTIGSRGKDVERVQRAVGVKPDGIFGPITAAAVENYQKDKGLKVDGIVGPITWGVLF